MEKIAVIFGGKSAEHDISIITAISTVIKPLELTKKYLVVPIYITKDGKWYSDQKLKDINRYTKKDISETLKKLKPISLSFDNGLELLRQSKFGKVSKEKIDVVFPSMHGTYGEDGTLTGLLEMANVPFVGCDTAASAVAMNKVLAKKVAQSSNINVVKYESFNKVDFKSGLDKISDKVKSNLKFPVFVKPAHLGSSIGISRAKDENDLKNAVELAFFYDDLILVEEEVGNLIEVTLPIIGNHQLTPAFLEKPLTKAEDFFDFDTKYLQGGKKGSKGAKGSQGYSEVPAKLDRELYRKAEEVGLSVYRALNLSGISRVDMLIDSKTNKIYFNEVNPLPGGLYIHNWIKKGISNTEMVERLVELAKDKYNEKNSINTKFSTSYLRQF
ncbi:D-alanine--D-alanine ligase [bacterium]|jgi:D-alanine-D-alanine ligase|nr:D-alanine--D-alanine ligase [bacterium]